MIHIIHVTSYHLHHKSNQTVTQLDTDREVKKNDAGHVIRQRNIKEQ